MSATEERIIKVKTVYDMAQPTNTLKKLEEESANAEKAVKKLEQQLKNAKDAVKKDELAAKFVEAKLAAEKASKAVEEHRKTLDLSKLTYSQLQNFVNKLNQELGKLVPNSEAWKKKLAEIGDASKHLNKAKEEIDKIKKGGEELADPTLWDKIKEGFGSIMDSIEDLGVAGITSLAALSVAVQSAFSYFTESFMNFEEAAADTKGELGLTQEQIRELKEEAQKTGPQFAKTAQEMIEAYNAVGSGKSELVATKRGLQDVTDAAITLSTIGKMNMQESAEVVVESLNQYGKGAQDAAKFVDILATGTKVGAAKIDEISRSLVVVGPVAKSANVSFGETNALLQVLAQNGIKGESAGTALRGTLLELANSTDKSINPTVVGLGTALQNLADKNLSVVEMTKLVGKESVSAAIALRDNAGKVKEWTTAIEKGGGAAEMYKDKTSTLRFQINQAKAVILNYAVSIGEVLAPIISNAIKVTLSFIAGIAAIPKFILDNKVAIGGLVVSLLAFNAHLIAANAQILYNAALTKGKLIWDKASAIATNAMTIAQNGLNLAMRANPIGLVISAVVALGTIIYEVYQRTQTFRAGLAGLWNLMKEGAAIISRIWTALKNLNFKAIATEMANATTNMAKAFTKGYADKIKEESKKATDSLSKDSKQQVKDDDTKTKKLKNNITELTDAQKKALQDRKKAQEEALKKIEELQDEAHLDYIRRTQGEVAAEKLMLQKKADDELLAVQKSLATNEQKSQQQKLIVDKLQRDLQQLEEQHQRTSAEIVERWTTSENAKKIKAAQSTANNEIAIARKTIQDKEQLAEVEKKINEWLKNELAAIEEEKATKAIAEGEKAAKKQLETATKRLNSEKFILEQEQKAELAVLDGLEFAHRTNAQKLLQIKKQRLDTELNQLLAKLELEKKAEQLKLTAEIKDEQELKAALENLDKVYAKREIEEKAKTEAAKTDLEKKASEARQKIREGLSNAFGALLKGDLTTFASHLDSIVQGEKAAWQQRLNENMGSYQMIGQMAVQAANFLNDLTQKRVAKEIEETKREFEEKKALLDASIQQEADTIAVAEQQKKDLKAQFSEEVKGIKNANEQMISDAEKFYNELSSADANEKFNEQVTLANQQAEEKIRNARRSSSDAIDAARNERDETIIAAEATRDAEIAAINARADLDNQTKQRLIEAARAKAMLEIQLATDEAETKMQLSKDEMEQKIKDAEEEKAAKIKLMEELMTADDERAKELLAAAEAEADKKVQLAEEEKNKKLQILEQEKAKRVTSKKQLEAQLAAEDKKAKNNEAQLKYKAAMTQWKTDQVSALVNGALATIKALASGFFPLNLVFAALTAVATGIQVAAIRKNRPEAPQSFAVGGSAPRIGIGGLPEGSRHGSQYGESGIALINRKTGREEGEMEGGEAIISRDQTEANLPLIELMWKKARARDKTPVVPMQSFRPMAFAYGGFAPSVGDRQMFLFGSKKRKAADAAAAAEAEAAAASEADTSGADTGDAEAAHAAAQKQGEEQLKLLTQIKDGIVALNDELTKVTKSTGDTTNATRAVERAVRETNQGSKLDGMIGLISSLGKKTAA